VKRIRTLRQKDTFPLDSAAPSWAHDFARQVERALSGYLVDPNFGPFTYKSDIITRMTDAQVDTFDTLLNQTTPRMRLTWEAIQAVYHRGTFFPEFYGMFVDEFGQSEADRILAVSSGA